jgi:uncharacterized protein YndB with AHSA1/START domain
MVYLNVQLSKYRGTMKVALVGLLIGASLAFAESPAKTTTAQPKAEKVLFLSITIPATRAEVWHAFATSEGLSTWLTPGAVVDLRPGGEWTAHYPNGKTGGGTIISFVPEEEMVLSAMAPEEYPTVRATRTHAQFRFKPRVIRRSSNRSKPAGKMAKSGTKPTNICSREMLICWRHCIAVL